MDEERVFNDLGAHFSKRPAENPWRGVLPKFDMFMERYDVYYFNYYWYIVKGRTHERGDSSQESQGKRQAT